MVLVTVNDVDYAVFQNARLEELDLSKIIFWVVNTFYDDDYKLGQYIAPNLSKESFAKDKIHDEMEMSLEEEAHFEEARFNRNFP